LHIGAQDYGNGKKEKAAGRYCCSAQHDESLLFVDCKLLEEGLVLLDDEASARNVPITTLTRCPGFTNRPLLENAIQYIFPACGVLLFGGQPSRKMPSAPLGSLGKKGLAACI
jgi:hypothetical protein